MALVPSGNSQIVPPGIDIPPGMPTTGPDLELQLKIWAGVEILWPFLRNPAQSPICAATVYHVASRFVYGPLQDQPKAALRILRTKHQLFLDAILYFVAIPRPILLQQALEWKLNHCECDLTAPVLETIHTVDVNDTTPPPTFKDMVTGLFLVLECVLENIKIGHVSGLQSAPQGQAKDPETAKWPMNTAAFFPAGPEEAIVSFTGLYRLTRSPSILDFIRVTLPHCPSAASPAMHSTSFWEAILEELEWAAARIDTDPTITGNSAYNPDDGPPPVVSIRHIVMLIQTLMSTFTQSLRQNIQTSCLMSYARKIHDALLKVLIDLNTRPSKPRLGDWITLVVGVAVTVITALPKDHPQRPQRLHPVLLTFAEGIKGGASNNVYSVIARLSESVAECCSASCTVTSESSARKLQYCAQCQVMRYCSGACQKAAWKYHKLVCKDVGKLKQEILPRALRLKSKKGGNLVPFATHFETEALKDFTAQRMKEIEAELMPFLHFQNAGMKSAASHAKANHY
ncbi:hypothetical protein DFH08DRAFT_64278 [Mycena albidolilacea]|uniref:MYND-type domain-containing protein n=1 Tax=Mycena albidolilacea TaxID=1033008 RepID=A0AAD7AB14_9AGAR|nr:hypothetical protein DFH08DRAFT_64278 [Mycena albidolilacea]